MALSGWCGERGRPHHSECRALVCSCDCHSNLAQPRGLQTVSAVDSWNNGGTNKDGPAGASTPVTPGLTDHEGIG